MANEPNTAPTTQKAIHFKNEREGFSLRNLFYPGDKEAPIMLNDGEVASAFWLITEE